MHTALENVRSVLELSTANMPGTSPEWGRLRVAETEYGFVVFLPYPSLTSDEIREAIPEWFRPAWRFCVHNEIGLVHFDRDADPAEDLPTWEW